ncbi:hypothetical protein RF11_09251 [Thelohanellus kitauei]|uniref:Uncharacterized protein n=1 Tax=Thelohanellus kitauei TaxID=669202 RepID=A0A0C2MT13_THEKT|nr:hypothetical protein RF11_09251 [Thelohanellus kitauei]
MELNSKTVEEKLETASSIELNLQKSMSATSDIMDVVDGPYVIKIEKTNSRYMEHADEFKKMVQCVSDTYNLFLQPRLNHSKNLEIGYKNYGPFSDNRARFI